MAARRHIFRRGPSSLRLLLAVSLLALMLIVVSTYTSILQPTRAFFLDLVAPFYGVTDMGNAVTDWAEDNLASKEELLQTNQQLLDENLILQRRVAVMAAVQAENARLRQLLGATEFVEESVLIAELVGTPPDTETHRLIVNRGTADGLREGLPVIDGEGVFGQIITAGTENSEVLLISDRAHALPVNVLRNGARAIAEGTGDYQALRLRNIPETFDVVVGDEIVSSGLGGNFPRGYPVGEVVSVEKNSSTPFLEVRIAPHAALQTNRQMLVLFSTSAEVAPEEREDLNSVESSDTSLISPTSPAGID